MILRRIKKSFLKPIMEGVCAVLKKMVYYSHAALMKIDWSFDNPEYYNHDCDLYYQWEKTGRAHWLERGIYNILALQMFENPVLVELCCGEGFNTKFFYSKQAKEILATDFSQEAIKAAKKKYQTNNINFVVGDIREGIPRLVKGLSPTNIVWDTAIEHFTPEEIDNIMCEVRDVLEPQKGILSGHTVMDRGEKMLEQHEYEFKDMDDVKRFLTPYFKNVTVFETIYEDRTNFYFWASNGNVPFSDSWSHMVH